MRPLLKSIFSSLVDSAFKHDWPRQCPQTLEHLKPIFLHPHLPPQLFVQLQKIVFSRSSGAGGNKVVTGSSVLFFNAQPHCSGQFLFLARFVFDNTLGKYAVELLKK